MGEHFIESDLQGARLLIDLATTNKSWSFLGSCACRSSALRIRSNYKNTEIEVEEENIIDYWYPAGIKSVKIPLISKCHLIRRVLRQHQNLDLIRFLRYQSIICINYLAVYPCIVLCVVLVWWKPPKRKKERGSDFEGTSGTSVKLQAHLVGVQLRIQSGLIS